MATRKIVSRRGKPRLSAGIAATAVIALSGDARAQLSELDAFQHAVDTRSRQDALAFIESFGSSHLIPDLIDLLPPDVAMEVCASLSGAAPRIHAACDSVALETATVPGAGIAPEPAPAAVAASVPAVLEMPEDGALKPEAAAGDDLPVGGSAFATSVGGDEGVSGGSADPRGGTRSSSGGDGSSGSDSNSDSGGSGSGTGGSG